ncbi:MAG: HEAT repeat domain-containing protein [Synechococcales cyanobacterium]
MTAAEPLPTNADLRADLDHPDPTVRMRAARIFCDREDAQAIPRLTELLRDPCLLVRVSAAYALGRNSDPTTVPMLIATFQQDWNGYVRKGVVWAMGNAQDAAALPVLASAVLDDIVAVRLWAASALGQLGARVGNASNLQHPIQALVTALQRDPVAAVRSNCAWALGQLHDIFADPRLMPILESVREALAHVRDEDSDLAVQDDAQQALKKLSWELT